MMRSANLSHVGRSHRAFQAQAGKVVSCSTVPPLPQAPSISADSKPTEKAPAAAAAAGGGGSAGRVVAPRRSEWRPSEAHKTSATSVARKEAQSAQLKAGVAPRAASRAATTGGTDKAKPRSPGLRRRELLGGAEDIQSQVQAQLAAASASASPSPETAATTRAAVAAAAGGEGSAPSVGSLSATSRFRARRELERLAAAGNAEAIEALRVSGSFSTSSSSSKPDTESDGGDGTGKGGGGGGGGGLTPLTVLPVLLALVGAGYCVVNDVVPREWLWRIGGGGVNGAGAGPGDSARAEGRSGTQGEEGKGEDVLSLSPLLRTLSRVAAFVPIGSSSSSSSSSSSDRTQDGGDVTIENASVSSSPVAPSGEAQENGGGWALWGWWRREREREAVADGSDDDVVKTVSPEPAGEEHVGIIDGAGQDDAGEQQQQQQQQQERQKPRWLRRAG